MLSMERTAPPPEDEHMENPCKVKKLYPFQMVYFDPNQSVSKTASPFSS
jgi:hypothetical protein